VLLVEVASSFAFDVAHSGKMVASNNEVQQCTIYSIRAEKSSN
jgi:hypothetical protein